MGILNKVIGFFKWLGNKLKPQEKTRSLNMDELLMLDQISNTNETLFEFVLDLATARDDDEIQDVIQRAKQWTGVDEESNNDYLH
tara:strand:- start:1729 stop:1983 length:255 start_codon:yes stop_codon:yes gene_type:complete